VIGPFVCQLLLTVNEVGLPVAVVEVTAVVQWRDSRLLHMNLAIRFGAAFVDQEKRLTAEPGAEISGPELCVLASTSHLNKLAERRR
jgi:hypothetical protein